MAFEVRQPVHAGDTVTCDVEMTDLDPGERRTRLAAAFVRRNGDGEVVLRGASDGVVPAA